MGFAFLPADISSLCPLPNIQKMPFGRAGTTRSISFRPRGFSPPRRFAPQSVCRFVSPCYQPEVRCVSPGTLPGSGMSTRFPASQIPYEEHPRPQPYRVTTTDTLLALSAPDDPYRAPIRAVATPVALVWIPGTIASRVLLR
jgi:hypothetical protein